METSIWYEVKLNEKDNLLIGLVYRSPNSTKQNGEALRKQLMMANTIPHVTHKLIFGDFNYPEIKWSMNLVAGWYNFKTTSFFGHCTRSTSSTTCGKNQLEEERVKTLITCTWPYPHQWRELHWHCHPRSISWEKWSWQSNLVLHMSFGNMPLK